MRRHAHPDKTQAPIAYAAKLGGCSVYLLPPVKDAPDLLVGRRGRDQLVECKSHKRVSHVSGDGLTDGQREWHGLWRGAPVVLGTRPLVVLEAMGVDRETALRIERLAIAQYPHERGSCPWPPDVCHLHAGDEFSSARQTDLLRPSAGRARDAEGEPHAAMPAHSSDRSTHDVARGGAQRSAPRDHREPRLLAP